MHSTEQAGGTGGEKQLTLKNNRGIKKLIKKYIFDNFLSFSGDFKMQVINQYWKHHTMYNFNNGIHSYRVCFLRPIC